MRNTILVADDSKFIRAIMVDALKDDFTVLEANDGQEAWELVEVHADELAAVLLDVVMPKMDGVELLQMMNEKGYVDLFPVMIVTGEQSLNLVEQCFDYGIAGFIRKPFKASMVKRRLKKIVELYMQKNDFKKRLETQTSTLRNQYKLLQKQSEQLKLNNESIINILGTIVEYRNTGSSKHAEHVRKFTEIIGRRAMEMYPEYRLTADKVQVIAAASVLHDIGKIMIPNDVLLKPGRLNEEELECIRSHAIYGYDIINNIAEDWNADYVQYSKEICKYHHERYDGKGYAEGLAGEDIPLSAQIVSIADSFDALISEKVYKRSYSFPVAFQMVLDGQCGAFSPKLLECFRNAKDELAACIEPEEDEPEDDMENPYLD